MNETKLQVLTQKNNDLDSRLHNLEGEFEEMKGQIEDDKKRKTANSTGYSMRNKSSSKLALPGTKKKLGF
jgi:predicted  nucleic acid-binding Zn-ribbon protein